MNERNYIRRFTAPLSLLMCILIIAISFYHFYGQEYEKPVILNSKFKYFTKDPITNDTKPYLWETAYFKGPNDSVFIRQDIIDGYNCLGMHVHQDGLNDTYDWATIHVKQRIRGISLEKTVQGKVGVWAYPTFTYRFHERSKEPENVFGIEINDGKNIIWYVFSDNEDQTYMLRNHRIVVIHTPLNKWSYRELDIAQQYKEAGWKLPNDISFILITGDTQGHPGNYSGYFREIVIE